MIHVSMLRAELRYDLQRIHIKVSVSRSVDARQHCIVQCQFHGIVVARLSGGCAHPLSEHHQPDGSAGLRIVRGIRQIVIRGKPLPKTTGSDAAGQIHSVIHRAVPQPLTGFQHLGVLAFHSQVCHGGAHIHGSYRMPFRCLLLYRFYM